MDLRVRSQLTLENLAFCTLVWIAFTHATIVDDDFTHCIVFFQLAHANELFVYICLPSEIGDLPRANDVQSMF